MASRLKTRLSTGAALVTGLGMVGLAAAAPAQSATVTQDYTCTYTVLNVGEVPGDSAVKVAMTVDLPATAEVGDEIKPDVSATVTIPDQRRDSLYGLLGVRSLDGPDAAGAAAEDDGLNTKNARNQANFTLSDGSESLEGIIPLSLPMTDVPDSGALVVDASGAVEPVTLERAGTYTIDAGDFQAYIRGYAENGDYKTNVTLDCTNVSEGTEIGSIEVTEPTSTTSEPTGTTSTTSEPTGTSSTSTPAPLATDWFAEPDSLPITEDGKHFTVEGMATQDGVLNVVLLDADKKVLKTIPWNATEGTNTKNFPFVEGTDYVRIISEDCLDADGNDGTVAGGCNVEYYAPWVNPSTTTPTTDAGAEEPEVPGVVQTDGFARTAAPETDNTAALALGSLLLVGAGAGVVLVARRRQAAQH